MVVKQELLGLWIPRLSRSIADVPLVGSDILSAMNSGIGNFTVGNPWHVEAQILKISVVKDHQLKNTLTDSRQACSCHVIYICLL